MHDHRDDESEASLSQEIRKLQESLQQSQRTYHLYEQALDRLRLSDRRLAQANLILKLVGEIRRALLIEEGEQEWLRSVCEKLHHAAGYELIGIGYAESDGSVRFVAGAGDAVDIFRRMQCRWNGLESELGPAGRAIRSGQPYVIGKIKDAATPETSCYAEAMQLGLSSAIALPLKVHDQVIGALCIYSTKVERFGALETRHLQLLIEDISFGIDYLSVRDRHQQAETELLKSQSNLAEAQQLAKIGSWDLDHHQMTWSDEMHDILEVDKEAFDASSQGFLEAIHPDDREKFEKAYADALSEHGDYEVGFRLLMADGRIKYVQAHGQHFYDEKGQPVRSTGTIQDISHTHDVEEQLLQAQKMEAVGTLVGGIAHDFNNKLAAINGNLYLAKDSMKNHPEALKRLQVVEKLSFEAASMVQQLLAFARKSKMEQRMPLSLVSFIKEAMKLHRVTIPENIRLSIDYGKDSLVVMGDVTQLQQVFLNLMTNARDALEGEEDAHIDIALSHYEPDKAFRLLHPESGGVQAYACLQVADNGVGIASENLEKIFDPFFTTKEVGKGTGLGLAMVYGVTKAHRGIVEVDSEPGKGSAFSIYLPLKPEAVLVQKRGQEEEVIYGNGELLLIADDDEYVREMIRDVLASLRYRVISARDGAEAVELYRRHQDEIALVILDMVMPHLKGMDAAKQIRMIQPEAKILYATGYSSEQPSLEGRGDEIILHKPFNVDEVGRAIREFLYSR